MNLFRPASRRARWTLGAFAALALAAVVVVAMTRHNHSPSNSVLLHGPTGNPNGDPAAQCKVLALGALTKLAQDDASVLADLDAGHSPSTRFIAAVVRRNQAAFIASSRDSSAAHARQILLPKVRADCLLAPS